MICPICDSFISNWTCSGLVERSFLASVYFQLDRMYRLFMIPVTDRVSQNHLNVFALKSHRLLLPKMNFLWDSQGSLSCCLLLLISLSDPPIPRVLKCYLLANDVMLICPSDGIAVLAENLRKTWLRTETGNVKLNGNNIFISTSDQKYFRNRACEQW